MKQDEINKIYAFEDLVELATQADCLYIERYDIWQMDRTTLKAFAKLVAMRTLEGTYDEMIDIVRKNEREACAKHLDNQNTAMTDILSAEIRARGEA